MEEVKKNISNDSEIKDTKTNKKGKKKKGLILIVLLLLILVGGCFGFAYFKYGGTKKSKTEVKQKEVKSEYRMSGNSLENFDLAFLKLENEAKNKVYSPLSIKYALEMLAEGSDGETRAQLDAVIGDYEVRKYENNEHMSFANAMFIRDSFKESIRKEYTDSLTTKFAAEVITDPFENASTMNKWVSDKTFNMINDLFDDDSVKDENFILANALAIDMNWVNLIQCAANRNSEISCIPYHVSYPHENYSDYVSHIEGDNYESMNFNGANNIKSVKVGASLNNYDIITDLGEENIRNTISKEYQEWLDAGNCGGANENPDTKTYVDQYIKDLGSSYKKVDVSTDFYLYDNEEIKVFAKDLKQYGNTTLQYVGIMPKTKELVNYVNDFTAEDANKIIGDLKEIKTENFKEGVVTKITANIPLFKFDYKLDFMNDLGKLGITDVFDINKANLTKMLNGDTKQYIESASHKADIEFSNEGIKAAAATEVGGAGSAGCWFEHLYDVPVETIDLSFDKPYLFFVRDKNTGEVWFTGTVYEPITQ